MIHKRTRLTAIFIAPVIWGIYVLLWLPFMATDRWLRFQADTWTSIPFVIVLAYGIAVLVNLFAENRHRLRVVMHPNPGRIIGALALFFVTPIAIIGWTPWICGGLIVTALIFNFNIITLFTCVAATLIGTLFWYPVSCLIISGTKNHWLRFGMFCLMFWASYCAVILLTGVADMVT